MSGELPRWVWDLLADLIAEEDEHPVLYHQAAGSDVYRQYYWCPAVPLRRVPPEIKAQARVIREYRPTVYREAP